MNRLYLSGLMITTKLYIYEKMKKPSRKILDLEFLTSRETRIAFHDSVVSKSSSKDYKTSF